MFRRLKPASEKERVLIDDLPRRSKRMEMVQTKQYGEVSLPLRKQEGGLET
jgi:hypothetical protein